uniref:Trypsin-like serine protease n=1 Tax=Lutzomyia longipalpis TaxID=7200 RepID=A0A1B0CKV0_LUTLO
MWIIVLFGFLVPSALGQGCNYAQQVGTSPVAIFSPNYPGNYVANTQCTWSATAPSTNYRLQLTCSVVQIPDGTSGCPKDYISISRTGRTDFADGYKYCGYGTFTEYSNANQMSIKLSALYNSPGGRFYCTIQAVQLNQAAFDPCNCGRRKSTRIVGGVNAGVNEFPMVAALIDLSTRKPFCGATLISNWRAITAQHCLLNQGPGNVGLLVGDYDLSTGADTPYSALYNIQSFSCYSNCNTNPQNVNDIAMVRTTQEIQMNPGVGIICLPWKYNTNTPSQFAGTMVEVSGWGDLDFGGPETNVQQKTSLNVINTQSCRNVYGNVITENHICTYSAGRDTCQRDSGESLMYTGTDNGRLYSVGIVSFGVECASQNPSRQSSWSRNSQQWLKYFLLVMNEVP